MCTIIVKGKYKYSGFGSVKRNLKNIAEKDNEFNDYNREGRHDVFMQHGDDELRLQYGFHPCGKLYLLSYDRTAFKRNFMMFFKGEFKDRFYNY